MSLPTAYVDASSLGVTPIDPARGRFGLSVETAGQRIHLALDLAEFRSVVSAVELYAKRAVNGSQSLRSSESPNAAGLPQEGQ